MRWIRHRGHTRWRIAALGAISIPLFLGIATADKAHAVPAFTDQTGQACSACHVGGFGPHLTPFGREFKLGGYTLLDTAKTAPISAMAVFSYLNTAKDQDAPPAPHYATNDNFTLDQASIFLAGGIGQHFGGFFQTTYDGVGRALAWDNLDLRGVAETEIAGKMARIGVSLNNSPGVQDVWNTLPAWGFPFTDSALAPAPEAAPILADALAQNVLGLSGYVWWDSRLYAEAGLYHSLGTGYLRAFGVDPADTSRIDGVAPYLRLAYARDYGDWNFEAGGYALLADLYPGRDASTGHTDGYRDVGIDGSLDFHDGENNYTLDASYTHERQTLNASQALGDAANLHNDLNDLRANVSYHWRNMLGATVGAFTTSGSQDAGLYAANRTMKPNSSGFIFQVDATPWGTESQRFQVRVGAQYTAYTRFEGATDNYDGFGRNALDNNAFRLFVWVAY